MAGSASSAAGGTSFSCSASTRKERVQGLKYTEMLFILGLACIYAGIVSSHHAGHPHAAGAAANGTESSFWVARQHPFPKILAQNTPLTTESSKQHTVTLQAVPPAEYRKLAAPPEKQVEEEAEAPVLLPEGQQEQVRVSIEAKAGENSEGNRSHYYGINKAHKAQGENISVTKQTLKRSAGLGGFHPREAVAGVSQVHPHDMAADATAHAAVPLEAVPVDSPLSGPLQELYIHSSAETYDSTRPHDGVSPSASPGSINPSTGDIPERHVGQPRLPVGAALYSTARKSGEEATLAAAEADYSDSALPPEQHGLTELLPVEGEGSFFSTVDTLAFDSAAQKLRKPFSEEQSSALHEFQRQDVASTLPIDTPALIAARPFFDSQRDEDDPTETASASTAAGRVTGQATTFEQVRTSPPGDTWTQDGGGELRSLRKQGPAVTDKATDLLVDPPILEPHEEKSPVLVHASSVNDSLTSSVGDVDVAGDSVPTSIAQDTRDFGAAPPENKTISLDNVFIPAFDSTADLPYQTQIQPSDYHKAPHVETLYADASGRGWYPFTTSEKEPGMVTGSGIKSEIEAHSHNAADIHHAEHVRQNILPKSEGLLTSSAPFRRAEPDVEAPVTQDTQDNAEGRASGENISQDISERQEVMSEEEDEEVKPEEPESETADLLSPLSTASEDISGTSLEETQPEASSEARVIADPRAGACSDEELTALTEYFSDQSGSCAAYRCVDETGVEFLEKLQEHYGTVYEPNQLEELAGLFAACYCRCPMMKCEVDYVMDRGSASCKAATVDYCETSNDKFVERCTSAAHQLPLIYDLRLDTAGFKVPCRVCRREDLALSAALVEDATIPVQTPDGTAEAELLVENDSSSAVPGGSTGTGTVDSALAGSRAAGEGVLVDRETEEPGLEESYAGDGEDRKEDVGLDVGKEGEYEEELPFLQLGQHVPPTSTSSAPVVQLPTAEDVPEAVVSRPVEQDFSEEPVETSNEDTQKPPDISTPPEQQHQPPIIEEDHGEQDAHVPEQNVVTIESNGFRRAVTFVTIVTSAVAPLLVNLWLL